MLAVDLRVGGWRALVTSVGLKESAFGAFGQASGQDFVDDAVSEDAVFDGEDGFDSVEEVSGHPIGASDVNFWLAGVFEVENPAVFEEASHDAFDGDVFAEAGHAGSQAADAADDELRLDAGLGGSIECFDHFAVH